ncbi:hypothetical protein FQR65_LT08456 [Abscondita terminalis]|nr:hypothetical protein FQR65_LT08456 [Abscondita terminalis]
MLENHVHIPFISDTGTTPPESCIFGQILNVGALLFAITMYVRYRQVKLFQLDDEVKLNPNWNVFSLVFGSLTSIGITIVGNFQETAILSIHMIGASMTFGCGTTYICIQTVIFYHFRDIYFKNPECDNIACWKEEDGGFTYKVVATLAEWLLALSFMVYIFRTSKEYKLLEFEKIRFKNKVSKTSTESKNKVEEITI